MITLQDEWAACAVDHVQIVRGDGKAHASSVDVQVRGVIDSGFLGECPGVAHGEFGAGGAVGSAGAVVPAWTGGQCDQCRARDVKHGRSVGMTCCPVAHDGAPFS